MLNAVQDSGLAEPIPGLDGPGLSVPTGVCFYETSYQGGYRKQACEKTEEDCAHLHFLDTSKCKQDRPNLELVYATAQKVEEVQEEWRKKQSVHTSRPATLLRAPSTSQVPTIQIDDEANVQEQAPEAQRKNWQKRNKAGRSNQGKGGQSEWQNYDETALSPSSGWRNWGYGSNDTFSSNGTGGKSAKKGGGATSSSKGKGKGKSGKGGKGKGAGYGQGGNKDYWKW
jgi:hypothetical protein